jgi:hypothetical protein
MLLFSRKTINALAVLWPVRTKTQNWVSKAAQKYKYREAGGFRPNLGNRFVSPP